MIDGAKIEKGACETPMADHIKRFWELVKTPGAIVRVDTPNPLGFDTACFGPDAIAALAASLASAGEDGELCAQLDVIAEMRLAYRDGDGDCATVKKAATRIRALASENERLRKALGWAMRRIDKYARHLAEEGDGELYEFASARSELEPNQ